MKLLVNQWIDLATELSNLKIKQSTEWPENLALSRRDLIQRNSRGIGKLICARYAITDRKVK